MARAYSTIVVLVFYPILLQITLQEKVKKTYYQKDNLYQIGDIDIQTNNGLQAM